MDGMLSLVLVGMVCCNSGSKFCNLQLQQGWGPLLLSGSLVCFSLWAQLLSREAIYVMGDTSVNSTGVNRMALVTTGSSTYQVVVKGN